MATLERGPPGFWLEELDGQRDPWSWKQMQRRHGLQGKMMNSPADAWTGPRAEPGGGTSRWLWNSGHRPSGNSSPREVPWRRSLPGRRRGCQGDGTVTSTERRFCQVLGHRAQEPEAERLRGLEAGAGRAGVEMTGRGRGAGLTVPCFVPTGDGAVSHVALSA